MDCDICVGSLLVNSFVLMLGAMGSNFLLFALVTSLVRACTDWELNASLYLHKFK